MWYSSLPTNSIETLTDDNLYHLTFSPCPLKEGGIRVGLGGDLAALQD